MADRSRLGHRHRDARDGICAKFAFILDAYGEVMRLSGKPLMLIAKTVKGKGVSFIENQDGWHGKALNKGDCDRALKELGEVDKKMRGKISRPEDLKPH